MGIQRASIKTPNTNNQMKKLLSIALLAVSLLSTQAQTNTNTVPILPPEGQKVWDFLSASSNLMVCPYGIMSTDQKDFGAGIALGFKVSELMVPVLRLDYYKGEVWMPSGSLQL